MASYSNVFFVDNYNLKNGWDNFEKGIVPAVHSTSDLFSNVEQMKEAFLPSKFNELLRQEYILQEGATWVHRCILNRKDIEKIFTLHTNDIKATFPFPEFKKDLIIGDNYKFIYYKLNELLAYKKLQKYYSLNEKNSVFDYFPKKYRYGVHGSSMLWSITDASFVPNFMPNDLDIRVCSEEGLILSETELTEFVLEFEENVRKCANVTHVHGINDNSNYFGTLIDTFKRSVIIECRENNENRKIRIDFYTNHWGAFNTYHVAMTRADLEIYPKLQLYGSFSFAYSLLTKLSVDTRLTLNYNTFKDIIKKYNSRGYNIYVTEDMKNYWEQLNA